MPLQNRVTPTGELIAVEARGMLMGNRGGRIHDPASPELGRRRWASKAWIACRTAFRDRHRTVWGNSYTELFFLDEVTALSAGHRPCFECRRDDATAFAAAVGRALRADAPPRAAEMDRHLHSERLDRRGKRRHTADVATLPDGAVIEIDGTCLAVRRGDVLPWSPAGWGSPSPRPAAGLVTLLTPPTIVAALSSGFRPLWHPSAGDP